MSGAGRVARNSFLQAGAFAFGSIGSLILYAVMARETGVEAFGDFTTAASLSVLVMVAAFGMDYRITRLVARGEAGLGESFWSAIVLKLVLGTALLAALTGLTIAGPYDERVTILTVLLGVGMLVDLTMLTPHAVFRGREDLQPVALSLLIYRGTLAVIGSALLLAGASLAAVATAWIACALLGLAYSVWRLRATGLRFPWELSGRGMRTVGLDSFGLGLAAVLGAVLARLDIILLGLLKDSDAVALYGAAYRLMESTQFLTTALALSSFPALTRLTRTSTPTLADATTVTLKVVLVITAPIAVVFVVYAEPLLTAIYGAAFGGAASTLQLLGAAVVPLGISALLMYMLGAQERQRPIAIALGVATAVNLVANLMLIPSRGAEGAALAMLISMVLLALLLAGPTWRVTGRLALIRAALGPAVAAALMAGLALALGASVVSVVPALAAFAVGLVVVERLLFPADSDQAVRALRRRLPGSQSGR